MGPTVGILGVSRKHRSTMNALSPESSGGYGENQLSIIDSERLQIISRSHLFPKSSKSPNGRHKSFAVNFNNVFLNQIEESTVRLNRSQIDCNVSQVSRCIQADLHGHDIMNSSEECHTMQNSTFDYAIPVNQREIL